MPGTITTALSSGSWPIPLDKVNPRLANIMTQLYHYQAVLDVFDIGHVQIHFHRNGNKESIKLKVGDASFPVTVITT